jgi:N-methylhydantoinase B
MAGGMSGSGGRAIINPGTPRARELAPLSDGNLLKCGDVVRIETGGGGGYGHPHDRPETDVLEDVLGGFVSQASAERCYGVVIDGGEIDRDATAARRANRPPVRAFHRNGYVDALV